VSRTPNLGQTLHQHPRGQRVYGSKISYYLHKQILVIVLVEDTFAICDTASSCYVFLMLTHVNHVQEAAKIPHHKTDISSGDMIGWS
jgi:hypothetical protein